jgi:alpha-mannosidase
MHSEIALTLLRCVGWLSRDDFRTRQGPAGPLLATPDAQMPGEWDFDYSIILTDERISSGRHAWSFASPLRASTTNLHAGALPPSGSFVRVDNSAFEVTALKEAADGRAWLVRGYNSGDEHITVQLKPWKRIKTAALADLAERAVGKLVVDRSGAVSFAARPHEIVTVLFRA